MTEQLSLAQAFLYIASGDPDKLKIGEENLKHHTLQPGFPLLVLQLMSKQDAPPPVQLQLAIQLKNFLEKHWDDKKSQHLLSEQMRDEIKKALLQQYFQSPTPIKQQLFLSIAEVSLKDVPSFWPSFFPDIGPYLNSTDINVRGDALRLLDKCLEKYRSAPETRETERELLQILKECDALIQNAFKSLVDDLTNQATAQSILNSAENMGRYFRCILPLVRLFHTLSTLDIPQLFSDNLGEWLRYFALILGINSNIPVQQDDIDDLDSSLLIQTQSEILDIYILFLSNYHDDVKPYVQQIADVIWKLSSSLTDHDPKKEILLVRTLRFLLACAQGSFRFVFQQQNALQHTLQDIVIPNLHIPESDINNFESDPLLFVQCDLEGAPAYRSLRQVCVELLRALSNLSRDWTAEKFQGGPMGGMTGPGVSPPFGGMPLLERGTPMLSPESIAKIQENDPVYQLLLQQIGKLTELYKSNPVVNWEARVRSILLVTAACTQSSSMWDGVTSIKNKDIFGRFLDTEILPSVAEAPLPPPQVVNTPEVQEKLFLIRSQELKFLYLFRNQIPPDRCNELCRVLLVSNVAAPNIVVSTYATCIIEKLVIRKEGVRRVGGPPPKLVVDDETFNNLWPRFMQSLYQRVHPRPDILNNYVMKAIATMINIGKDNTFNARKEILNNLIGIMKVILENPHFPTFNHFLFEALAALIRLCCKKNAEGQNRSDPNVFFVVLQQPFAAILSQDPKTKEFRVPTFIPYVIQLFILLTNLSPTITPPTISLLQFFLHPVHWEYQGFVKSLTALFSTCFKKYPAQFFPPLNPAQLQAVSENKIIQHPVLHPLMDVIKKLILSPTQDIYAFSLLDVVIEVLSTPTDATGQIQPIPPTPLIPPLPFDPINPGIRKAEINSRLQKVIPFQPNQPNENKMFYMIMPYLVPLMGMVVNRLTKDNSARFVGRVAKFVSLLMFRRGVQFTINLLQTINPSTFLNFLKVWTEKANSFHLATETKCSLYGLLCVLTDFPPLPQNNLNIWESVFKTCYKSFDISFRTIAEIYAEEANEPDEPVNQNYEVDYSALVYTRLKEDRTSHDPLPYFTPPKDLFIARLDQFLTDNEQIRVNITPDTMQLILKLIRDPNFQPHGPAISLKTRPNPSMGFPPPPPPPNIPPF